MQAAVLISVTFYTNSLDICITATFLSVNEV